ncbi:hypothetical protein DFA_01980 [Cavenderia fasciculata]|uniref:VASt domain-containing protein n=1 Tax=Cavenderia fasciculata TaxID=261658 RepID=F4PR33_CACFS|nr:uncharacterized protein DFA_01980 [Cavenderia fasciculata]EGG22090.1 hypothetical protein DFA_01980 [Cavenderia fasciculata]|eukprot:XP_004359941.1 hypothetical protein DFA_01980 [Cavenderia fasciculata]
MKEEKITRELECSLAEFIQIYRDESSQNKYHLDRGDINILFNQWNDTTSASTTTTTSSSFSYDNISERTISFQAPINAPPSIRKIIGKDATTIVEKQKIQKSRDPNQPLLIQTHYRPDIMGDYFQVESEWIITPLANQPPRCKLELILRTSFNMRFVGNVFELFIIKAAASSAAQYVDVVQDYLELNKLNRLKQLKLQLQSQQQNQNNNRINNNTNNNNNNNNTTTTTTNNNNNNNKINNEKKKKPIPINLPITSDVILPTTTTTTTTSTTTNNNNNNITMTRKKKKG